MPARRDEELDRRLAAATRRDTVRGVVFNATFEVVVELAGKPAAAACDPLGKGRRPEFFSYPVADYLRLAWAGADRVSAGGDRDSVFHEFGARAARRWLGSPLAAALVAFTGRDPRRLIANVSNGYRNVVSYGRRSVEWVGERHARLAFRRDFLVPPFHCGVLAAALQITCGARFEVSGREVGFLESDYDVIW